MSKDLTLKIMKEFGYNTNSTQEVIAFISKSSINENQKKEILKEINGIDISSTLVLDSFSELKNFLNKHEDSLQTPIDVITMFLKNLPDELDRKKSVEKEEEKALTIVPVDFLNSYSLYNLITNTMDGGFWEPRVTNVENKEAFSEKFGRYSVSSVLPELNHFVTYEKALKVYKNELSSVKDKILALKHLVLNLSNGEMSNFVKRIDDMEDEDSMMSELEDAFNFLNQN